MKGCLKKRKRGEKKENKPKNKTTKIQKETEQQTRKKNHQIKNIEVFPAWDLFQTKSTYIHFKGPSSEKETPNQLDLIVNKCQQKK